MIVSRSLGFVFVKAKKVGGTSVEMALSTICDDPADIVTPITPLDERVRMEMGGYPRNFAHRPEAEQEYRSAVMAGGSVAASELRYRNHMKLAKIAEGIDLAGLRVLGVVRSPCGIAVSSANHRINIAQYRRDGGTMRATAEEIRRGIDELLESGRWTRDTLSDFYRRVDGSVEIETLRYERLTQDFSAVVASIKPEAAVALPRAKAGLALSDADAAALLTPDQRRRIRALFAEDIDRFGYGC